MINSKKERKTKNVENKSEKNNRKNIKWVILAALIVFILIFVQHCLFSQKPLNNETESAKENSNPIIAGDLFPELGDAKNGHLSNMTPEQIKEQMQKIADESQFSFKINSRPVFADGSSNGDFRIENPHYNIYPMVVQIYLDETDELIYDSGGILPNQHIDNAKLISALDAGTYNATAVLNAYDPDSKIWQGKAQAALIITVQN